MRQMLIVGVLVLGLLSGCAEYYRGVAKMSGYKGEVLQGPPASGQPFPPAEKRSESRP